MFYNETGEPFEAARDTSGLSEKCMIMSQVLGSCLPVI